MADDKKSKGAKSGDKPDKGGDKAGKGGGKPAKPGKAAEGSAAADAPRAEGRPHAPKEKPRLATYYLEKVRPALMQKFGYTSIMQAPRFEKIVVNMGVGDALQDSKLLDAAALELGQISGQRPSVRR